jgi:hypothetical protein
LPDVYFAVEILPANDEGAGHDSTAEGHRTVFDELAAGMPGKSHMFIHDVWQNCNAPGQLQAPFAEHQTRSRLSKFPVEPRAEY